MNISLLKKKWVWGGIVLVVGVGGIIVSGGESAEAQYEFATIDRANVDRFVDAVGVVRPIDYVDVSFEQSGRVAGVYVVSGERVYTGQILASLVNADVNADVAAAQARVEIEEARLQHAASTVEAAEIKLNELLNGSRPEEVTIKRAAWNTAVVDFSKAITDTSLVRDDAYNDVQYSIEVTLAPLFLGQQGTSFDLAYASCDAQHRTDVEWQRYVMGESIATFVKGDVYTDADALAELSRMLTLVLQAEDVVRNVSMTLSDDCTRSDVTLDGYRSYVDTARARLKTARNALNTHRQLLTTKRNARDVAEADLHLAQQGPRPEVVAAQEVVVDQARSSYAQQEASVRQAQASYAQAGARAAKTVIRSPISGTIVKHDVRVGSFVTAQQSVMRVSGERAYEVEVFIPELDVAEVEEGAAVRLTLDAYGDDEVFDGHVYSVELAETFIEGVPTYKTTIHFDQADDRIASGMTANVEILVAQREDVVVMPIRAVQRENGRSFVRFLRGEDVVEIDVETGLKGSDGRIEISGGEVKEGDRVILFEK